MYFTIMQWTSATDGCVFVDGIPVPIPSLPFPFALAGMAWKGRGFPFGKVITGPAMPRF